MTKLYRTYLSAENKVAERSLNSKLYGKEVMVCNVRKALTNHQEWSVLQEDRSKIRRPTSRSVVLIIQLAEIVTVCKYLDGKKDW